MRCTIAALLLAVASSPATATTGDTTHQAYDAARPGLLQVRSLVDASGRQSSLGSAFQVSADGLAMTNYHVIAEHAMQPDTYRLEYTRTDGVKGGLRLVALDVAHDLAVVRLDQPAAATLALDAAGVASPLQQGQRLYAMGDPLDIGFTIVEGTYNGIAAHSYSDRFHFTGAINPGMSGGPVVDDRGRVVAVNVAKRLDGELVSFLVPGRFGVDLLARAQREPLGDAHTAKAEIGRQLLARQTELYTRMRDSGFHAESAGRYRAPASAAPWFQCWSSTNANQEPAPRARVDTTRCDSATDLFLSEDLQTGGIDLRQDHVVSKKLNGFQFAHLLDRHYQPLRGQILWRDKSRSSPRCHDDFVLPGAAGAQPKLRAAWCARAYRDFDGLYDVSVSVVTQDRSDEALVLHLDLQAVPYELALAIVRDYLGGVSWVK